jgi:hypothetical protein
LGVRLKTYSVPHTLNLKGKIRKRLYLMLEKPPNVRRVRQGAAPCRTVCTNFPSTKNSVAIKANTRHGHNGSNWLKSRTRFLGSRNQYLWKNDRIIALEMNTIRRNVELILPSRILETA